MHWRVFRKEGATAVVGCWRELAFILSSLRLLMALSVSLHAPGLLGKGASVLDRSVGVGKVGTPPNLTMSPACPRVRLLVELAFPRSHDLADASSLLALSSSLDSPNFPCAIVACQLINASSSFAF